MSGVIIAGNTSGSVTLDAPAVAGSTVITLPTTSGTMLLTNGNGSALTNLPTPTALSTATGSAPSYSARAWVNFNAQGTIAIVGSGNVSSITDVGVGIFTVNYTTAMQDANYAVAGTTKDVDGSYGSLLTLGIPGPGAPATTYTASATSIATGYGGSVYDPAIVCLTTFR